jgi:hypothetical protein
MKSMPSLVLNQPPRLSLALLVMCVVGLSLDLVWLIVSPPRPFSWWWGALPGSILAATGAFAVRNVTARASLGRWMGLCLAGVWAWLLAGFLMTFPGVETVIGYLVLLAGAILGLITSVVFWLVRAFLHAKDAAAALCVMIVIALASWTLGERGIDAGLRLRFALVKERYESALSDGEVAESGGFMQGSSARWYWVRGMVGGGSGVMHYSSDDLLADVPTDRIPLSGGVARECKRLEAFWYWCTFD